VVVWVQDVHFQGRQCPLRGWGLAKFSVCFQENDGDTCGHRSPLEASFLSLLLSPLRLIFLAILVCFVILFPRPFQSHVSSLCRRRVWWWRSWLLFRVVSVACGSMLSSVVCFTSGIGGWVSFSPCLRPSTLHINFCCFCSHLPSSSSVVGCAGRGEWGCR
jgi:hypothetical protein